MLGVDLALKELLSQPTPWTTSLESSRLQHPVPDGAGGLRGRKFYQEVLGSALDAGQGSREASWRMRASGIAFPRQQGQEGTSGRGISRGKDAKVLGQAHWNLRWREVAG